LVCLVRLFVWCSKRLIVVAGVAFLVRIVKSIIENRHKFKGAMALSFAICYSCSAIEICITFLVLLGAFLLNKVISLLLQKKLNHDYIFMVGYRKLYCQKIIIN
jgi:hypothetical protein